MVVVHVVQVQQEEVVGVNAEFVVDPTTFLHDNVTSSRSGKDEEKAKFGMGQQVKLLEDIKNDGTYPHAPIGTVMIKKNSIGYIKSIGEFLQVIRVYEVHFLDMEALVEVVGCREHELEAMEEFRDEVQEERELIKKHREKFCKK